MKRLLFAALAAVAVLYCRPAHATVTTPTTTVTCTGTGAPMTCALPFPFQNNSDLVVTLQAVTQVLGTHYTVSCAGCSSGGSVTMVANPPGGQSLVVTRIVPLTQPTSLRSQGPFRPATYELAFDWLEMQIQQVNASIPLGAPGAPFVTQAPISGNGTQASPLTVSGAASTFLVTATGAATAQSEAARAAAAMSVLDFGAVCDSSTDNVTAFTAAATYANANPKTTLRFPDCTGSKTYNYSGGLVFTQPVTLTGGQGAILNYTGSGIAVKMGPDGLSVGTFHKDPYRIVGLTFAGGTSMTQGIYFNTFVVAPSVEGTRFSNFGSAAGYAIFFQSQNWDARVTGIQYWVDATSSTAHNAIRANGIASDGTTSDQGQTQLRVSNSHIQTIGTYSAGDQVGVYYNGVGSTITNSNVAGFSPQGWVGSNAGGSSQYSHIDHVYMENVYGSAPCIRFGESSGSYTGQFTVDLTVSNSYCNVHNTDFSTTARFIAPAGASSGLQRAKISNNVVTTAAASAPLVVLNNLGSQSENWAWNNLIGNATPVSPSATNPLHTAGGSISSWTGTDGDVFSFTPKLQISTGLTSGAGGQHQRFGATCTTAASAAATCTTGSYTWATPFADGLYTVACMLEGTLTNAPLIIGTGSKTAASFTLLIGTLSGAAASASLVDCTAFHD